MKKAALITGADGYLGRRIAHELLAAGQDHVVLAVRGTAGHDEFAAKVERLTSEFARFDPGRISIVPADLRRPDALDEVDAKSVTQIVHAAAVTEFNVDLETARAVNLEGTICVGAFAARCENLQRLTLLSTLFAVGRRTGDIAEARHPDSGYVNHYEWSKWAAEEHLYRAYSDLPLSVIRLPTVIADDDTGRVTQYHHFHNTLKLYYYGLLSLIPGLPETPLYYASAEFTVAAIMRLLDPAAPPGIYHACAGPEGVTTLGALVDVMFAVFESDERFRRRRLLRPIYCDEDSFHDLVAASRALQGSPLKEAMNSVSPFAPQLFLPKVFRNDALCAAWPDYRTPATSELVEATTRYLVTSRWGRATLEES